MNLLHWKHKTVAMMAMLVTSLMLSAGSVSAHGGHAHREEGGFDTTVLFQAGGAALAVGIAYLVASAVYRRHDARQHDPDR